MKIPQLNGNVEHLLLSSMIVYTFIGILFSIFQYTFIGWVWGGQAAHLYQVRVRDTPPGYTYTLSWQRCVQIASLQQLSPSCSKKKIVLNFLARQRGRGRGFHTRPSRLRMGNSCLKANGAPYAVSFQVCQHCFWYKGTILRRSIPPEGEQEFCMSFLSMLGFVTLYFAWESQETDLQR